MRQERARDVTRAEIQRAALALFLDEGFERVSMRRIAEAVGYTPGALYAYFRDKDEILYALHVEGFARLRATVTEADEPALAAGERLYRLGELYLRFAFENPQLYQLMFITSRVGKRIREHNEWQVGLDNYDHLRGIVRECMTAGAPASDAPACRPSNPCAMACPADTGILLGPDAFSSPAANIIRPTDSWSW